MTMADVVSNGQADPDRKTGRVMDHTDPGYVETRSRCSEQHRHNGAYYYSLEIVEHFVPNVRTDRNWVTVNEPGMCMDHSVVFIHNNMDPGRYNWLACYSDLVLVCGVESTCGKVAGLGRAVYLPLSVDVAYVSSFAREKDADCAFFGRPGKRFGAEFGPEVSVFEGLPRPQMLAEMARHRRVFAVGRTAIEAKVLGCEVLPYDSRYPDPSVWEVRDSSWAAAELQRILDGIDGFGRGGAQGAAEGKEGVS